MVKDRERARLEKNRKKESPKSKSFWSMCVCALGAHQKMGTRHFNSTGTIVLYSFVFQIIMCSYRMKSAPHGLLLALHK